MNRIDPDTIARLRDAEPSLLTLRLQEAEVRDHFQTIFSPAGIQSLTKQDITGFLSYEQNTRWKDISRENVTADMEKLRSALLHLTDESLSITQRLNDLEPGRGPRAVPYLGKAKLTPILHITQPKQYGIWNDFSERALLGMGIFPTFTASSHLGDQYELVNMQLLELAKTYSVSLWHLDIILERIARLVR